MKYTAEMFTDLSRTAHDPEAGEKAAALLNGTLDPDTVLESVLMLDRNERVLEALNKVLDCHGVEGITPDGSVYPIGAYINSGDTYSLTVVLDEDGEFHLTTWGDFLEAWEREQAEEGEGY